MAELDPDSILYREFVDDDDTKDDHPALHNAQAQWTDILEDASFLVVPPGGEEDTYLRHQGGEPDNYTWRGSRQVPPGGVKGQRLELTQLLSEGNPRWFWTNPEFIDIDKGEGEPELPIQSVWHTSTEEPVSQWGRVYDLWFQIPIADLIVDNNAGTEPI